MAKTFEVEIGGKVRKLGFHQRDAIALKKRFGETPHVLLFVRCLGLDYGSVKAGELPTMRPALFDAEVQMAVLHRALVFGGWNVTEEAVVDHVDKAVKDSDGKVSAGDLYAPAIRCALYSGAITGTQIDIADAVEAKAGEEAAAEGKAPTSGDQA